MILRGRAVGVGVSVPFVGSPPGGTLASAATLAGAESGISNFVIRADSSAQPMIATTQTA
jgi:hypothetical protein